MTSEKSTDNQWRDQEAEDSDSAPSTSSQVQVEVDIHRPPSTPPPPVQLLPLGRGRGRGNLQPPDSPGPQSPLVVHPPIAQPVLQVDPLNKSISRLEREPRCSSPCDS